MCLLYALICYGASYSYLTRLIPHAITLLHHLIKEPLPQILHLETVSGLLTHVKISCEKNPRFTQENPEPQNIDWNPDWHSWELCLVHICSRICGWLQIRMLLQKTWCHRNLNGKTKLSQLNKWVGHVSFLRESVSRQLNCWGGEGVGYEGGERDELPPLVSHLRTTKCL